jgi:hypothetical protein
MMAGCRVLLGLKRAPDRLCRRTHARLKQRKTVGLQFMQDRHASDEQDQKFQETGQRAFGLVLVDEQKQNRADKTDSERVKHIRIYLPL